MLWFDKKEEAILERPEGKKLTAKITLPDEYLDVCDSLKFRPPVLKAEEALANFQNFCFEKDIKIFNRAAVDAYLRQQVELTKRKYKYDYVTLNWVNLRPQDNQNADYYIKQGCNPENFPCYSKKVPIEALKIASVISNRYPEAKFYVSDITRHPDPFLAVAIPDIEEDQIVAVWDEPAYTTSA